VTISWNVENKGVGPLTVGWGVEPHEIGPELMFGTIMGEKYDEPVLLIKTAWGGKDVYCDFRSPSAGEPTGDAASFLERERAENNNREIGYYYRKMGADIKDALVNIGDIVPGYEGQGYELAGMAWFQGWNDFCQWPVAPGIIKAYPQPLSAMFRHLRKALDAPGMPIVIGELGVGGHKIAERAKNEGDHEAQAIMDFRAAQKAVGDDSSLKNVTFVPTADFWDDRLQELRQISDAYWGEKQEKGIEDTEENHLPTKELNDEYLNRGGHWYAHYNGSAANYSLVGYALAKALNQSEQTPATDAKVGETKEYYDPVHKQIEGWTVAVDPRLMAAENEETRREAFKALANHLQRVKYVVPEYRLTQLQELRFWMELDNPKLGNMQYHPSRGWLIDNGHDPRLVKHIHIPHAKELCDPHMWRKHPYVVLHELAHSFHDQVLSFEHPDILGAFEQAKEDGTYEQVLLYTGEQVRHYALTDHKEYFAEATEAYFGVNDFYPFVRAELEEHDPALFSLMEEIWSQTDRAARRNDVGLAMTPPMGWNSWNVFQADIDGSKIRAIADAMVSSGMRDAGYTYLVLDDGWMAEERDENDRLVADPKKFPSGMKAVGDYIHSKGLKYGIYEDRGEMTCQQLPGSFGYEQIDMDTFADWGVDYIKMDSCFAESNGRMSPEDYALYRECIQATGRPMVLSISDFGNGAWAWGGKESSQLWRTSNDIYPWMDSIYACAETSAGNQSIHPAFNGLWQFAGPGHWNDPDMLQVGNLKDMEKDREEVADRAHFSLWCILAAPLMAGNDLRTMSENTRKVLTAPELIAVNQDERGVQGYKIFDDGDREVYNKPLSDGRTAVLLLNKGDERADFTVRWETIGLSGTQPVRDLWARTDLGEFKDSFTARDLGQHEHKMLKVGRPGPPLPAPAPMPLEKYIVTRKGETHLSDLYYIWKEGDVPVYDAALNGERIKVDGKVFKKGFGSKGRSAFMFKLRGRADRFQGIVAIDSAYAGEEKGRFKVFNGDAFSNKVLWDSGQMTKDSPAKEIDIELKNVECLMLVFEGDDVLGNWADARVISDN
jgi:hypothetical protein